MPELTINGIKIDYIESVRSDIRNTYLRFDETKLLVVSRKRIRDPQGLILKHRNWVLKHYAHERSKIRFFSENRILWQGVEYKVERQLYMGRPSVSVDSENSTMVIKAPDAKSANVALERYLKRETLKYATAEASIRAGMIGEQIKSVRVRKTKRWGACNSRRMLSFNSFLCMLPQNISEYVITHEIAHLKELNHSKKFWKIVGRFHPDYKELRAQLHRYDSTQRPVVAQAPNGQLDLEFI